MQHFSSVNLVLGSDSLCFLENVNAKALDQGSISMPWRTDTAGGAKGERDMVLLTGVTVTNHWNWEPTPRNELAW